MIRLCYADVTRQGVHSVALLDSHRLKVLLQQRPQKLSAPAGSGERIQEGNSVRDQFFKAVYDQIWTNLKAGGLAQVNLHSTCHV